MRIIYIYMLVLILFGSACTDKFEEFNTDKKNPAVVTGNSLFSNAEKELSDQINSTNVNQNIWKIWAQYWTETTYTEEANYDVVNRNIPDNIFRYYYREPLTDLKEAARLIDLETTLTNEEAISKKNRLNIIEILNVYAFVDLVDIFGAIPYSEALDINNVYPQYEDGYTVYKDLLNRLNTALNNLDASQGSFGSADFVYDGDVALWKKFGNSLKIKMGIALADFDESLAKTTIESAVAGSFSASDDNATFPYISSSPNQNPLYEDLVASGRDDFVPTNTIVDIMNSINDPRRASYFTLKDTSGKGDLVYIGGRYGYTSAFTSFSHINPAIQAPDYPGYFMTYTEVLFYLTEAAARGFAVNKTVEEYYNLAVTESILEWGGSANEATTFLSQPEVAYNTAPGTWRQKIALQSWIASYTKGLVGYNTWRRLDYPVFNLPENTSDYADIPVRFTFPVNEQTLNKSNYDKITAAMGGDELTIKVFWDKY